MSTLKERFSTPKGEQARDAPDDARAPGARTDGVSDQDIELHHPFGGPWGAFSIMLFSHVFLYYLYTSNFAHGGRVFYIEGLHDIVPFAQRWWSFVAENAAPTVDAFVVYTAFIVLQLVFAAVLPGVVVKGLPVKTEGGRQLPYLCNGVASWYATLLLVGALHWTGVWRVTYIVDNFGALMTVAVLYGDAVSVLTYAAAFLRRCTTRMTGNHVYDFFMGAYLNPRFGIVDLKMWAEIRISWILLFLITLSCAAKQYDDTQTVSWSLVFMLTAHFLYANACQKGEECIPTTWDIFYEKWGWMLIYWNMAGVPFAYCFQSVYILKNATADTLPSCEVMAFNFALLLFAYYVFDTANSQKNRFRMMQRGTYVPRRTFPQLPWGTLPHNAKVVASADGSKTLLVDGWYRYARKIHYTADTCMALSWGIACGFGSIMPYYYVFFFAGMITHRVQRDEDKCSQKYGDLWRQYKATVPYVFIPYVI